MERDQPDTKVRGHKVIPRGQSQWNRVRAASRVGRECKDSGFWSVSRPIRTTEGEFEAIHFTIGASSDRGTGRGARHFQIAAL